MSPTKNVRLVFQSVELHRAEKQKNRLKNREKEQEQETSNECPTTNLQVTA